MTNIHTKPGFYIGLIVLIFIGFILYQLYKLPDSFDVSKASLLGFGNITTHYEKRGDKFFKKTTSSIGTLAGSGIEVEISKTDYQNAYKQYQAEA